MILHLLTDEKFTDYAIKQFSAPEFRSEFILVPSNNAMEYVKLIDKCIIVRQNSPEFDILLNRLDQYTGIIFHGLFWGKWQTPILQKAPKNVKVAWYFFGGEIYSRHELETAFMTPITKTLYKTRKLFKQRNSDNCWEIPIPLFNNINYCLTSMYEEFEYAKWFTKSNFEHMWYTCYSLEETVGPMLEKCCDGNNVWIGNSSAIKNNHFDALWILLKCGLLCRLSTDVIIPLSYGDPWVRNLVLKVGRVLFGKRMHVLTDYMPRNEYNALMLSCSTMIIGYTQPAAQGNIITGLWLGMRVYLSEKSMAYTFYKRIGAYVFSLESDLATYAFKPLPEKERAENRKILRKWYSKQYVMDAVKNVVYALQ